MSPGGHLVTTAFACAGVYGSTGSVALTLGLAAGGFLIDIDHFVDYVLFERQRNLSPAAFLRYYLDGKTRRVVLMLHSYELFALLALLAWAVNSQWLWGWVLGMALHLPLDVVFNGKFATGGLVHFYSFIVRARRGFLAASFTDKTRLPAMENGFWVAFFRGGRLTERAEGAAPPSPVRTGWAAAPASGPRTSGRAQLRPACRASSRRAPR
jgi:hypothetical protein